MSLFDKIWSKPVDRNKYASFITDSLKSQAVEVVTYDADSFCLKTSQHGTMYLENGYARYLATAPKDRDAAIENFASALASNESIPDSFEEAKSRLIPLVRDAAYYSLIGLMAQVDGQTPVKSGAKTLTDGLVVGLGYDRERSFSHISVDQLEKWQISFEEASSIAARNLRDITDPVSVVEHAPGLYLIATNDSYDSSRLLLTDLFEALPLFGEPVAFIPDRDHLWIAGANDTVALAMMLTMGEKTHFDAYPLSAGLFILSEGQWHRWELTEPSLARTHREIVRRRLATDYKQQKEALDKVNGQNNLDIFVASCLLFDPGDGGETYSACVWSNGIPSLLPGTDKIILLINPDSKEKVIVSRTALQSAFPNLLQRVSDLFPDRFKAYIFPTSEQIATLRMETD